jgi:hypothetical protein
VSLGAGVLLAQPIGDAPLVEALEEARAARKAADGTWGDLLEDATASGGASLRSPAVTGPRPHLSLSERPGKCGKVPGSVTRGTPLDEVTARLAAGAKP